MHRSTEVNSGPQRSTQVHRGQLSPRSTLLTSQWKATSGQVAGLASGDEHGQQGHQLNFQDTEHRLESCHVAGLNVIVARVAHFANKVTRVGSFCFKSSHKFIDQADLSVES